MTAQTTLNNIQAITRGESSIQSLVDTDPLVVAVLDAVDLQVEEALYGRLTEVAQRYLAAHFLSQALTEAGGRGPLASETIGGISQAWTLPYLNIHSVLGSTQYGMQFLEYRAMVVVPAAFFHPT